ncbi:STAS domain-containing protein [Actinoplanes sp. Pm04-4]|uniref:STAS domain-containing protein n=1 Tax=Paractinoplanes pyxinae TaxID=2997416 RepID=A0ABT4BC74_9ACTN|nr:STAS domain-containing protein [Actinoplanes pyxinae]MCY1143592.1 STAS domain-containing protein [Actinoplanes pyxinae]
MPYEQPSDITADYLHIDPVVAEAGRLIRLIVRGELDSDTARQLTRVCTRMLSAPRVARVELDLTEMTFIDAAGVRSLLTCREEAETADVAMTLRGPTPEVTRVLSVLGLLDHFVIADDPVDRSPTVTAARAEFHGEDFDGWRRRSAGVRREAQKTRSRALDAINRSKFLRTTDS